MACGARPSGSAGSARSLLSVGASGSGAGDSLSHSSTLPVVSSSSSGGDSHGHSAAALLGPTKPRSMLGRPAPISISGVPSDLAVLGGVEPVPHGGALSGGDDHSPGISPKAAAAASAGMGRALTPSSSHSPRASCVASASGTQLPPAAPASLSLMQRDGRLQHPHSPLRLAPPALGVLSADPPPVRGAPPSPILRVPSMPALLHHAPAPSRHLSSFSTFSPMRSAGGGTGTGDSAHYGVGGTGSGSDDPPLGSVRQSAHSMRGHERTGPFMRMKSAGGDRDGAAAGGYVQGQQQLQQSRNGLGLPAVDSGISWAGGRDGDAAAAAAAAARRSVGGFAAAGGVFSAAAASAAGAGAGAAIRPTLMRQKSDGPLRAASPGSAGSYGR
ncbi:hypothetical protein FOA52_007235 [Chlamydomonas sp. UWO 241]|nr:hypothetical protein FOA52_007235 [Chlamydomonas sp. UWO 241]